MVRTSWMVVGLWLVGAGCTNERGIRRIEEPPVVDITVPEPDQVIRRGEGMLTFEGTVSDSYDDPEDLVVTWTHQGEPIEVSAGADGHVQLTFDPQELELGEHELVLHAADTDGMAGQDGRVWTLAGALQPPVVQITSPEGGSAFEPLEEITLRGTGTDNNTEPDDLVFTWTSSLSGELPGAISGGGQSVLFTPLAVGAHEITLTVTDIDGLTATDVVELSVGDDITPPVVEANVGDVVFSEVLVQPLVVDDEVGEWIELYNASTGTIDLDGYSLADHDLDTYTIMGTLLVGPDTYVVLCADTDQGDNGGIPCDGWFFRGPFGGNGALALGNQGDEIVLKRPDGTVIDEVVYAPSWFDAGVAKGVDPSVLDHTNNDDESMWCHQTTVIGSASEPGTPGFENDACL
ncbi:MAG: lamin tail domain-containing protein [Myxococcales bacterium]|nr:lamin tail domain-containing protein [Myxococcales bacterium]